MKIYLVGILCFLAWVEISIAQEPNWQDYRLKQLRLTETDLENIRDYNQSLPHPIPEQILALLAAPRNLEHYPIYRFGNSPDEVMFFLGTFHGNERQGKHMVEALMATLVNQPQWYQNKTIYCVPVVNPAGYFNNQRVNENEVDLNRNFPTPNFQPHHKQGTSQYAGPYPLSEEQSQIIYTLLAPYTSAQWKHKVKIVSIHSAAQMNNFDGVASLFLASEMAKYNQLPAKGYIGYPTPGSFGTLYGKVLKLPIVTLETRQVSPEVAWQNNREALLAALKFPAYPEFLKSLKF